MDPVTEVTSSEPSPASEPKLKCPELPILESYQFPAPSSFWQHFPISLPSAPTMPVKVGELTLIVETLGHKLTSSQEARADFFSFFINCFCVGRVPDPTSHFLPTSFCM